MDDIHPDSLRIMQFSFRNSIFICATRVRLGYRSGEKCVEIFIFETLITRGAFVLFTGTVINNIIRVVAKPKHTVLDYDVNVFLNF